MTGAVKSGALEWSAGLGMMGELRRFRKSGCLEMTCHEPTRDLACAFSRSPANLQGQERAEHPCGWQRCGAGELLERHLPLSMTLQADHLRFLSNNHSRPIAATNNTATIDHSVGDVGSSLGVGEGFASDAFDVGGCTTGGGFGVVAVPNFLRFGFGSGSIDTFS